jgi:hypothetical protein
VLSQVGAQVFEYFHPSPPRDCLKPDRSFYG